PRIQRASGLRTERDAFVAQQDFGVLRRGARGMTARPPRRSGTAREPHLYHVALDGRALAHACVESLGYDIDEPLLDRDLDLDSRVPRADAGSTGSMTNGSDIRGTDSRMRPTTSPGRAATSLSAASACPSPGPAPSSRR